MEVESGITQRLTDNLSSDGSPSWSPSGKHIAFNTQRDRRDKNFEIYTMDADGGNTRNLTRNPATDWNPSWSPSGKRIAFESNRDGDSDIYVMDVGGGNLKRLTKNSAADEWPDWARSDLSVSPASKQFVTWGWLKDRDYNVTLPVDDSVSDDGLE